MILYPNDAPFSTTVIPRGASRYLTQDEVDAANLLYPVPPYGATYTDPNGPPVPPVQAAAQFIRLSNIVSQDTITLATVDTAGFELMHTDLIFVLWPIAGVIGIVDDVGARPARVLAIDPPTKQVSFNFDSSGLDVTGLVLLGVVYVGDLV